MSVGGLLLVFFIVLVDIQTEVSSFFSSSQFSGCSSKMQITLNLELRINHFVNPIRKLLNRYNIVLFLGLENKCLIMQKR